MTRDFLHREKQQVTRIFSDVKGRASLSYHVNGKKISWSNDEQRYQRLFVYELNHTVFCTEPSELSFILLMGNKGITPDIMDITDFWHVCIVFQFPSKL